MMQAPEKANPLTNQDRRHNFVNRVADRFITRVIRTIGEVAVEKFGLEAALSQGSAHLGRVGDFAIEVLEDDENMTPEGLPAQFQLRCTFARLPDHSDPAFLQAVAQKLGMQLGSDAEAEAYFFKDFNTIEEMTAYVRTDFPRLRPREEIAAALSRGR